MFEIKKKRVLAKLSQKKICEKGDKKKIYKKEASL
jgi:hypothetical protein